MQVEIVKAQCESDLERVMVPMQCKLEQLRSQRMGESQYAETFKRMESEKRELEQKVTELERMKRALLESLAVSSTIIIMYCITLLLFYFYRKLEKYLFRKTYLCQKCQTYKYDNGCSTIWLYDYAYHFIRLTISFILMMS